MYIWPVLLPAQTNREDFVKTISLFDDDSGQAIDVSGRTLANPGDFTGSVWSVTVGVVNTSAGSINITPATNWTVVSTSSDATLTIKDYPFGNEMQAISLTVGLNLPILAGAPVTISDPTGLNTMTGYVTSYAPSTGALVCQIGSAFDFEIREHTGHHDGYGQSDFIGSDRGVSIIRAQLGQGIYIVGLGIALLRIPAFEMAKLRHRTYSAAVVIYDGDDTRQLVLGKQPILEGGVSRMPFPLPQTSNPYGLP